MIWISRHENQQRVALQRLAARLLQRWPELILDEGGAEYHKALVEAGLVGADNGRDALVITDEGRELMSQHPSNRRREWAPG